MVQVQAWLNHAGTPRAIHFNYYTLLVAQSRVKLKWQSQLENCRVNYNTLARASDCGREKRSPLHLVFIN